MNPINSFINSIAQKGQDFKNWAESPIKPTSPLYSLAQNMADPKKAALMFSGDMTYPEGFNTAIDSMTSKPMSGPPLQADLSGITPSQYHPTPNINNPSNLSEQAAGWQPGLKSTFDYAMLTKDAATIKNLLSEVPADYLAKYAPDIQAIIGKF